MTATEGNAEQPEKHPRACENCGRPPVGKRRHRCGECGKLVGMCCQGGIEPYICSGCFERGYWRHH